jgi:MerR family mercuric resistance operon transcriptional regulator
MVRSQATPTFTIGQLAAAADVGVETIRFYQRKRLIDTPAAVGGVRHYGASDLRRLRFIRQAQAAGFTLAEIGELLALDAGDDRARARAMTNARIEALDAKIAQLQQARDALQRLARECGRDRAGPCPILASFGV